MSAFRGFPWAHAEASQVGTVPVLLPFLPAPQLGHEQGCRLSPLKVKNTRFTLFEVGTSSFPLQSDRVPTCKGLLGAGGSGGG